MKLKYTKMSIFAATLITFRSLAGGANAAILITVQEVGSDVVVSYSGSLDLSSTLVKDDDRSGSASALWSDGSGGYLHSYNRAENTDDYNLNSVSYTAPTAAPQIFGGGIYGGVVAGDSLQIDFSPTSGQIWVPDGYISNTQLSGSNTFQDTSFADLSPVLGTYEWSWSNGGNSDGLTLIVGSVPEPSSVFLLGIGVLGVASRRKRMV
ncbi:MAG: PEP-CTERM sorting domain-containing protein [Akkermansiaceae bacterium]